MKVSKVRNPVFELKAPLGVSGVKFYSSLNQELTTVTPSVSRMTDTLEPVEWIGETRRQRIRHFTSQY